MGFVHPRSYTAWFLLNTLTRYIDAHEGAFPASEEALVEEGYLRRQDTGVWPGYELCPDGRVWVPAPEFADFSIAYGAIRICKEITCAIRTFIEGG